MSQITLNLNVQCVVYELCVHMVSLVKYVHKVYLYLCNKGKLMQA